MPLSYKSSLNNKDVPTLCPGNYKTLVKGHEPVLCEAPKFCWSLLKIYFVKLKKTIINNLNRIQKPVRAILRLVLSSLVSRAILVLKILNTIYLFFILNTICLFQNFFTQNLNHISQKCCKCHKTSKFYFFSLENLERILIK